MSEPTIALCMMVRDAAGTLHEALASAVDYVDEVCVLDTGSTDGQTPSIAQRFATRFHQCRIDPFHFADARNMSVDLASSDYILILDSDESLRGDGWKDLRGLLKERQPGSVSITLVNRLAAGTIEERLPQRRVFRREGLRWAGRVHHYLAEDPGDVVTLEAEVYHTGFDLEEEERIAKYQPRIALNRQAAREHRGEPAKYAHYRFKLAEALMMTGEPVEAASLFKWCFKHHKMRHLQYAVGAYWQKALIGAHIKGRTLDKGVAEGLALTMAFNARKRKDPVVLFHASWLLMLVEEELQGLALMAEAHDMTMHDVRTGHHKRIDEAAIRSSIAGFLTHAGMSVTARMMQEAIPQEGAALVQEFAEAFRHNYSPIIDVQEAEI